jgi:hypothetical protein
MEICHCLCRISADGINVPSTPQQPIAMGNGFHCSDMLIQSGLVDPAIAAVQSAALAAMKNWLAEWQPNGSPLKNVTAESVPNVPQANPQVPRPINASSGTL